VLLFVGSPAAVFPVPGHVLEVTPFPTELANAQFVQRRNGVEDGDIADSFSSWIDKFLS
jgi:hypothetical protein